MSNRNKMKKVNKIVDKRSSIQTQISLLLYQANSKYGLDNIHPTIDEQREMYEKISELRKELSNI